MRRSLERTVKYANMNKDIDLSSFNGHYPLFIFAPLAMDFLAGKFSTS